MPLFLDMLRGETAASPERRDRALLGLAAYQAARREPSPRPAPARRRQRGMRLRDYGGVGRPVVVVPSLINPATILDLSRAQSLMRWLAMQGLNPWLVDWGTPDDPSLDITGHVERRLVPALRRFPLPPVLVGYCLGGTMALAAACRAPVAGLATIASPWRFDGYGAAARAAIADLWSAARPTCERLGVVPMELLQAGFWRLDPARTIAKYERFAGLDRDSEAARAFVRLEDWANAGEPLTLAAGRQLFDEFIAADVPGQGRWAIGRDIVSPAALPCPSIEFVSLTDRIVPAATAAGLPDRRDLGAGHVGMIVGGRAHSQLWEPLAGWINALPASR